MRAKSLFLVALLVSLTLVAALSSCGNSAPVAPTKLDPIKPEPSEAVSGKIMSAIAPKKKDEELKIKLKREKGGDYAWEIDGNDVAEILKADRELNRKLQTAGPESGRAGEE